MILNKYNNGLKCKFYPMKEIDKDNFEDACCWDEENNCAYGFESISPTETQCLGCGTKWDRGEWSVEQ